MTTKGAQLSDYIDLLDSGHVVTWPAPGQAARLGVLGATGRTDAAGTSFAAGPNAGEWNLGAEWGEPVAVEAVELEAGDLRVEPMLRVEYWLSSWPTPALERFDGARRGWVESDDPWHGRWAQARGEWKGGPNGELEWRFDPLDWLELAEPDRGAATGALLPGGRDVLSQLEWAEDFQARFRKTLKVRLVFEGPEPPGAGKLGFRGPEALAEEVIDVTWGHGSGAPAADWSGELGLRNARVLHLEGLGFKREDQVVGEAAWRCRAGGDEGPKGVRARLLVPSDPRAQGNGALVTLRTAGQVLTFAPSDLGRGPIWVAGQGVLIGRAEATEAGGRSTWLGRGHGPGGVHGRRSFYDAVAAEPEQSFERARAEIPPLDVTKQAPYGRYVILGWEGARQKFALRYNGELFADKVLAKLINRDLARLCWPSREIHFRFGTGDPPTFREGEGSTTQWLDEPEVPIYTSRWVDREIEYTQVSFAAPLGPVRAAELVSGDEEVAAFLKFQARNTSSISRRALLWADVAPQEAIEQRDGHFFAMGRVAPGDSIDTSWQVQQYERPVLRVWVARTGAGAFRLAGLGDAGLLTEAMLKDARHWQHLGRGDHRPGKALSLPTTLLYEVDLPPGGSDEICLAFPFSSYTTEEADHFLAGLAWEEKEDEVRSYWRSFSRAGAHLQVPDETMSRFTKVVPWHILMGTSRDSETGYDVVPPATYTYGACGNEACMQIRALDMWGHHDRAERYLETFLETQGTFVPDGRFGSAEGAFVAVAFDQGKPQLGPFRYTLDHGYVLECLADHYSFSGNEDWLARVAPQLVSGCDFVTRERERARREDAAAGLLPAGRLEDNREWGYWFAVNAHAFRGLQRAAEVLGEVGHPDARRLSADAAAYREDIRRAARCSMEGSPVVEVGGGQYVPHLPSRAGLRGRELGWFREVAYGALHLAVTGVLDPNEPEVEWILRDLEDNCFLSRDFGRDVDGQSTWFSGGGVTIQANLLDNGPLYLTRGQPRHAVRALYNNFTQHIYEDVLVFTEHPVISFRHGVGPFVKTADEAQFLVWLRTYLLHEDGRALEFLRGAPASWWEREDNKVVIRDMATSFGATSLSATVLADAQVELDLLCPRRRPPDEVRVWLRHPSGRPLRTVVQEEGAPGVAVVEGDCVILRGVAPQVHLWVRR